MTHLDLEYAEQAFNQAAASARETPFMFLLIGMGMARHDPAFVDEIDAVVKGEPDYNQEAVDNAIQHLIDQMKAVKAPAPTKFTVGGN